MSVTEITSSEEYSDIFSPNFNGVVKYTASWCGPCKKIAPVYSDLAKSNPELRFYEVDLDSDAGVDASDKVGIRGVPTFHLISNGKVIAEVVGASQSNLREMINSLNF